MFGMLNLNHFSRKFNTLLWFVLPLGKSTGHYTPECYYIKSSPSLLQQGGLCLLYTTCRVVLMICSREWSVPRSWGKKEECGNRHFMAWNYQKWLTSKVPVFGDNSESLPPSCWVSININLGLLNAFHVLAESKERIQVGWGHNLGLDGMGFNWIHI